MSTYSGAPNTPYYSEKIINAYNYTQIDNILLKLPDNSNQLIKPKNVRDAVFTIWENISFKNTGSGTNSRYIGIDDDSKLKFYFGKKQFNGVDVMNSTLLNSDSDFMFYNVKGDTQSTTKLTLIAGTNTNLFTYSPYIQAKQVGTNSISLEIYSYGDISIGTSSQNIKIYGASGSIGILNAVGNYGDIQIKGTGNTLLNLSTGTVGTYLTVGTGGVLTWGYLSVTSSIYNFNQILRSGNTTDGLDIIMSATSKLQFLGSTPSMIKFPRTSLYEDSTNFMLVNTGASITIKATTLKLSVATPSQKTFLMSNDSIGTVVWSSISDKVDYNYILNKPDLTFLGLTGGTMTGDLVLNSAKINIIGGNLQLQAATYGIKYVDTTNITTAMVLRYNATSSRFVPSTISYNILTDTPNLTNYVNTTFLAASLSGYATTTQLNDKENKNANPRVAIITDLDDFNILSGEYYLESIVDIINVASLPTALTALTSGIFLTIKKGSGQIVLQEIHSVETDVKYYRSRYNGAWNTWLSITAMP